jgi:hypothetical protein
VDRDLDLRRVRDGAGLDLEKRVEPFERRLLARVGHREVEIDGAVPDARQHGWKCAR